MRMDSVDRLSDYKICFEKGLMGWTYSVKTPNGGYLSPLIPLFMKRENAEKDAMKRIELHMQCETIDGGELRDHLQSADQSGG